MAVIAVQDLAHAGADLVQTTCEATGDLVPWTERTMLLFENTNAQARNVTITPQRKYRGATIAPVVINVPATNGRRVAAGYDPSIFCNEQGCLVLSYDAVAGLSISAVRLP